MEITLDLPEELAARLQPHKAQLPYILDLGLSAVESSSRSFYDELDEVLERLTDSPRPEEVLSLRPSPKLQSRLSYLLEKNRTEGLSEVEEREWERYEAVEHKVRLAKANAVLKLKAA